MARYYEDDDGRISKIEGDQKCLGCGKEISGIVGMKTAEIMELARRHEYVLLGKTRVYGQTCSSG